MSPKKKTVLVLLLLLLVGGGIVGAFVAGGGDAGPEAGAVTPSPPAGRTPAASRPGRRRSGEPGRDATPAPAGDPAPATGADAAKPAEPNVPAVILPEKLKGRVVDAVTGEPVGDVRVFWMTIRADGRTGGGSGATTDAEGRFDNERPQDWETAGWRAELRAAKDGYETVRMPLTDGEPVVRLQKRTHPMLPGRVRGALRDADGHPVTGVVLIEGADEILRNAAQYAVADAGGVFVLEGVPAGYWRFSTLNAEPVEIVVPEDADAHLELRVSSDPRSDAERVHGLDGSRVGYGDKVWIPRAEGEARKLPPPREVIVTGIANTPGAALRAGMHPRLFWRSVVSGGEARFAALTPGAWTLTLTRPGEPDAAMNLDVAAGEGPLRVEFKGR